MRMAYKLHFLLFFLPRNSPRWLHTQFPHNWLVGCLSRGCKTVLPWAETRRRHQTHWRCARTLPSLKKKIPSKVTQNLWVYYINMFRICIFCDIKKKRNFTYSQGPHLGLDYIFQCYKQLEEEGRCQHTGLKTSDCHGAYVRLNLKFKNSLWYKRHDIKNYIYNIIWTIHFIWCNKELEGRRYTDILF